MPSVRARGKADRRAAIVAKAAELFIERGYDGASVNDVAAALEMSVGGLYRYIDTKSDLLTLVCDDIYGQLPDTLRRMAAVEAPPVRRLATVCFAYLRACAENRSLILLMYREYRHLPEAAQQRYGDREEELVAILRDLVADCLDADARTVPAPDPDLVARDLVLLGHLPALKGWALRRRAVDPEALLRGQLRVMAAMISAPAGADEPLAAPDGLSGGALRWSGVALSAEA